jgi:hypothetical protein
MDREKELHPFLSNWKILPKDVFIPLNKSMYLLKTRDTFLQKKLFNTVEPIKGIKFTDIIGEHDYFLGEIIDISRGWKIINSRRILVLKTKNKKKPGSFKCSRNDGFVYTYSCGTGTLIITTV